MSKQLLELQHIDLFSEKGCLVLETLLTPSQREKYAQELHRVSGARNLWHRNAILKTLSLKRSFAHLAMELCKLKTLRLACDHLFPSLKELQAFFKEGTCLKDLLSFNGLEIALLLNLSSHQEPLQDPLVTLPVYPGSALFFSPTFPLQFPEETIAGPFFLIVYAAPQARYIYKKEDPFTHDAKKEHAVFGDVLSNQEHPFFHS